MKFTQIIARSGGAITLLFSALFTSVCRADCDHTTYAYEDRVVVMSCNKAGGPELHIIPLDDATPLKILGRTAVPSARGFDAAGHHKNFLLLVRYDQLEVYDLADLSRPALAASFVLKKREGFSGYEQMEQTAPNKVLVLTSLTAVEVTTDGEPSKWSISEIPPSKELKKKMFGRTPDWKFTDRNEKQVLLRETPKFRYELVWREKSSTGEIMHRHYLRKVDLATGQAASEMLLGEHLETID